MPSKNESLYSYIVYMAEHRENRQKSHAGSNKACLCVVCVQSAVTHSYGETSAESAERLVQTRKNNIRRSCSWSTPVTPTACLSAAR